ncbi:MAG: IS1 family transposase [Verrucomicrobiota bacterium]
MNKLSIEERAKIVSCLTEGCSLRTTVRLTGFSRKGVARVMADVGKACADYHDKVMRNLTCKVIQVDEVWSFTYCKQANIPEHLKGESEIGDTWTWIAIDSPTKLIPCWYVGDRTAASASRFIHDLKGRLKHRIQLTSDGYRPYLEAVEDAFGGEIDFAMLIKIYGKPTQTDTRYSPPQCTGARKRKITGEPDRKLISTSYVERQNLTLRMTNRRFTRLTNAFSKTMDYHKHSLALYFMNYNFCRIHQTLRVTPAMEAGLTDHVWSAAELAALKC